VFCPRCRTENGDAAIRCAGCGAPIAIGEERPGTLDAPLFLDRRSREREEEPDLDALRPVPIDWEMAPPAEGTPAGPRLQARPTARRTRPVPAPASVPATVPAIGPAGAADFDLEVDDEVEVDREVEVHRVRAPAWRRAASWVVDGALLAAGVAALLAPVLLPVLGPDGLESIRGLVGPSLLAAALLVFAYLWLGTALMGATPGLRMAGLHIVGPDGRRPSPGRAAVRSLLAVAALALLGTGILLALFTRSGRGAHDLAAGTWVVLAVPAGRAP
jgi:uncharacterized RDD family membrane protein YckC